MCGEPDIDGCGGSGVGTSTSDFSSTRGMTGLSISQSAEPTPVILMSAVVMSNISLSGL